MIFSSILFNLKEKNYKLNNNLFSFNSSFINNINPTLFSYEKLKEQKILNYSINKDDFEAIISILNDKNHKKNQNYSHFLQMKILCYPKYSNNFLYHYLYPNMLNLINNIYGNLIYQSFIEVLDENNFINFLNFLKINFKKISQSQYGTRVIQKLIEKIF